MRSMKGSLVGIAAIVAMLATIAVATSGAASTQRGCTIKGTAKADVLKGNAKANVICGLAGNDKILGLAGNDTLLGGPGNDTITGGPGKDLMNGAAGNDAFFAADGRADRIFGGAGNDRATVDPVDVVVGVENVKYTAPILSQFKLEGATFTVGSKAFTEQRILGHIAKQALEFTGAKVNDQTGLGGTSVNRQALISGKIDMYWEYTGTGWIVHLNNTQPVKGSQAQYVAVRDADRANGVAWLSPGPFDNTYAFAVRKEAQAQLGVTKISDFARLIRSNPAQATLCGNNEFLTRDDGLPGVEKEYGFKFPRDKVANVDLGLIYALVDKGEICNFGEVFATDSRIEGLGLAVIQDDKQFFPVYNPSLNVRVSVLERYPQLARMFKLVSDQLTNARMQRMNADVDVRGKFPEEVARDFLKSVQLTS